MARTLFDHIKGVTKDKVKWECLSEEDRKSWNNFIITRWFSMEIDLVEAMNEFQKYSNGILQSSDYYRLLFDVMPKSSLYLKYTKKKNKIDIDKKFIELLCSHYQISKRRLYEYIRDMNGCNSTELSVVLSSYGLMNEEINLFEKQIKTIK